MIEDNQQTKIATILSWVTAHNVHVIGFITDRRAPCSLFLHQGIWAISTFSCIKRVHTTHKITNKQKTGYRLLIPKQLMLHQYVSPVDCITVPRWTSRVFRCCFERIFSSFPSGKFINVHGLSMMDIKFDRTFKCYLVTSEYPVSIFCMNIELFSERICWYLFQFMGEYWIEYFSLSY